MIKIGLTGNYFSGMDDVIKIYNKLNIPVYDADLVTKFILNYSELSIRKIRKTFGDVYDCGLLNLNKFDTNNRFELLLNLINSDLLESYYRFLDKNKEEKYVIFKSSILFENKYNKLMDYNINIFKPCSERYDLVDKITSIDSTTLEFIISNELSEDYKCNNSDFIINNYSEYTSKEIYSLENQVLKIDQSLLFNFDKEVFA
jgi:dephospho-CoA kinase